MKTVQLIGLLFFIGGSFISCTKKHQADERIYARWKISDYYINGQSAYDTIKKYHDGDSQTYEFKPIDVPSSQSYCGCSNWLIVRNAEMHQIVSTKVEIGTRKIAIYLDKLPYNWDYTFQENNPLLMKWAVQDSIGMHQLHFLKVN